LLRPMWHGPFVHEQQVVRRRSTAELTAEEISGIRDLLWAAFPPGDEGFKEDDWQHALGGQHFVREIEGTIVSHASVVGRELHVAGQPLRTGYVEAVATAPDRQGQGLGSAVMRDAMRYIRATFELGALGTGEHGFYERLGWKRWQGQSFVREPDGPRRTPNEDGNLMVLTTPSTPPIQLDATISCDWRQGDVW
jgi:aminoglycoside 2'-N-acetyltransferase I